jgi:ferritin-like metal-binding protein YciE
MAELTVIDEKLAEVLGLAQVAQQATKKVSALAKKESDTKLVDLMKRVGEESREIQDRCQAVADTRDGQKTNITKKARETKAEVAEFMATYLEDAEALDGLEFMSMAEAGELAHWRILATLNERAGDNAIQRLVDFAVPLEEKHVSAVQTASLRLAAEEDPHETA